MPATRCFPDKHLPGACGPRRSARDCAPDPLNDVQPVEHPIRWANLGDDPARHARPVATDLATDLANAPAPPPAGRGRGAAGAGRDARADAARPARAAARAHEPGAADARARAAQEQRARLVQHADVVRVPAAAARRCIPDRPARDEPGRGLRVGHRCGTGVQRAVGRCRRGARRDRRAVGAQRWRRALRRGAQQRAPARPRVQCRHAAAGLPVGQRPARCSPTSRPTKCASCSPPV